MIPLVYDVLNRWAKDDDFFSGLVKRYEPETVADLGCGTGRLTVRFADDAQVVGIDPNEAALTVARQKPGANRVTWLQGDSRSLETAAYDLVLMTANVSQVFLTDEAWYQVVADAYRALKPGGHFAFDTRNPNVRIWEQWMRDSSPDIAHVDDKTYEVHTTYGGFKNDIFSFNEAVFDAETEIEAVDLQLRFRPIDAWQASLEEAGFQVECYGDFTWREADAHSENVVFIAKKIR